LPILRGLDGVRRMGKSLANYIGVGESANEQFAKVMSIPDELMPDWFTLLTDRDADDIGRLTNLEADQAQTLIHPMVAKKMLGGDIVSYYHGADAANAAQAEWERRFSQGMDPTEIPSVNIAASELDNGCLLITKLLVKLNLAKSGNEARQKVVEGAVTIGADRAKIIDPKAMVAVTDGLIVRLGNRRIARVKLV